MISPDARDALEQLRSRRRRRRLEAIESLRNMEEPEVREALLSALSDSNFLVAQAAARALLEMSDEGAHAAVAKCLDPEKPQWTRLVAAHALALHGDVSGLSVLKDSLAGPDIDQYAIAVEGLMQVLPVGVDLLLETVEDEGAPRHARELAIQAVETMGGTDVRQALHVAADSSDRVVRDAARAALHSHT